MTSGAPIRIEPGSLRERRCAAPARAVALVAGMLAFAGCTPRPLLARAIAARGGPLAGVVLRTQATVYVGAPGTWECTRAFLAPNRYAWEIHTAAEPIYQLYDGTTARGFIGTALMSSDSSPDTALATHARWTAVMNLDALRSPLVRLVPLPAADLPAGAREGLLAQLPDGSRYRLGFDDRSLLVWAQGPLDFSPFGTGQVTARFSDPRRAGRLLLPFATSYALDGTPIADERVLAACVDPPALTPVAFVDPRRLPECP